MKKNVLALGLVASLGLSGCAFTTDHVRTNYQTHAQVLPSKSSKKITVGHISDSRGEDPKLLFHKRNAYGTTSGKYVAEAPVSSIIESGLRDSLYKAHYISDNRHSSYTLNGNLLDFSYEAIQGLFDGDINSKMMIEFSLINNKTGKTVWNKTFKGHTNYHVQILSFDSSSKIVRQSFNRTTDNVIEQLVNSHGFRNALHS